jgi:hypothetical protein
MLSLLISALFTLTVADYTVYYTASLFRLRYIRLESRRVQVHESRVTGGAGEVLVDPSGTGESVEV